MTYHGDCTGPVGAHVYHSMCPHTWTSSSTGREHVCKCSCHNDNEEAA